MVLTAVSDLSTAVECMKAGASDYLVKPVVKSRFDAAVRRLLEIRELREQVTVLRSQMLEGPGTEVTATARSSDA